MNRAHAPRRIAKTYQDSQKPEDRLRVRMAAVRVKQPNHLRSNIHVTKIMRQDGGAQ